MSFSLWGDKPVAFFDFVRGTTHWRYTNADRDQDYDGHTWTAAKGIKRSAIRDGSESRQRSITVSLPSNLPLLNNWRPYPPRDPVSLVILVRDRVTGVVEYDWRGRVIGPKRGGPVTTLSCEPSRTTARNAAPSMCWQIGCPLAQYSQGTGMCNLVKAEWAVAVAGMTQVDTVTYTATEFEGVAGDLLAGGLIEWPRASDGLIDNRSILTHDTATGTITVAYPLDDIDPGLAVTAYPYCRQDRDICRDTFDNLVNNGGEFFLPRKSPTDGQPVR